MEAFCCCQPFVVMAGSSDVCWLLKLRKAVSLVLVSCYISVNSVTCFEIKINIQVQQCLQKLGLESTPTLSTRRQFSRCMELMENRMFQWKPCISGKSTATNFLHCTYLPVTFCLCPPPLLPLSRYSTKETFCFDRTEFDFQFHQKVCDAFVFQSASDKILIRIIFPLFSSAWCAENKSEQVRR